MASAKLQKKGSLSTVLAAWRCGGANVADWQVACSLGPQGDCSAEIFSNKATCC